MRDREDRQRDCGLQDPQAKDVSLIKRLEADPDAGFAVLRQPRASLHAATCGVSAVRRCDVALGNGVALGFVSLLPGNPCPPLQLIDNLSEITCMGGSTVPEHAAWVPQTKEQRGSHRVTRDLETVQDLPDGCRNMCGRFGPNNTPAKHPDETVLWQAVSIIQRTVHLLT
jgi:hypothetical protein